jgi:hypothetical protein
MPNLKANTKSIWADSLNDEYSFCFYLPYHEDGSLEIRYPTIPELIKNKDCNFKISKLNAIDTLIKINFIKKTDNYIIDLVENFEWRITKKENMKEEEIKIDIRTGRISDIKYSTGVDY